MTLRAYGAEGIGRVVDHCCDVAQHLAARVRAEPSLELLAPVALNIVCFRVREGDADLNAFNNALVADVQEAGIAAPSTTTIDGKLAIRAGIFNHRSVRADADALVDGILAMAEKRRAGWDVPSPQTLRHYGRARLPRRPRTDDGGFGGSGTLHPTFYPLPGSVAAFFAR